MKITYKDGKSEEVDANFYLTSEDDSSFPSNSICFIKRSYDSDDEYDEDEDKEILIVNFDDVRSIEL